MINRQVLTTFTGQWEIGSRPTEEVSDCETIFNVGALRELVLELNDYHIPDSAELRFNPPPSESCGVMVLHHEDDEDVQPIPKVDMEKATGAYGRSMQQIAADALKAGGWTVRNIDDAEHNQSTYDAAMARYDSEIVAALGKNDLERIKVLLTQKNQYALDYEHRTSEWLKKARANATGTNYQDMNKNATNFGASSRWFSELSHDEKMEHFDKRLREAVDAKDIELARTRMAERNRYLAEIQELKSNLLAE